MATNRGTRAKLERVFAAPLEREEVRIQSLAELVVVRESDASDLILFEDMAYKTISMVMSKHPEFAPLLSDLLGPILEPERYGAVVERRKGSTSVQFVFADILFLYHLGSAAMVSEDEDINFFTGVLLETLRTHSIKELHAFAVHRLVRDEGNGIDLGKVFFSRDIKVYTSGQDFDFSQPYGVMMWNLAVTIAAQERNGIVERNRLGRIAVARRNQWPHGPKAIPLGYRLHKRGLVPVEAERERVGKILTMMGDPELSTRQFVERLGMLKVTRPGVKELYGDHATVAVVRHPKDLYQSFVNMLTLYENGVYEMPLPNPTRGSKMFGGLPVHGSNSADPKDHGFVVLRYNFGLPEGGWAPPEVFEAIRAKQQANQAFVVGSRERRVFGGRPPYEVGGIVYQLESSGMDRYRVCRLEGTNIVGRKTRRPGESRDKSLTAKESLATVDVNELHRSVVTTIVEVLSNAATTGAVRVNSLHVEADPAAKLRLSIDFHNRRADRAREEALRTDDDATSSAFRREAEIEEQAIAALLDIDSQEKFEPDVVDTVRVDVGRAVALLAKIVRSDLKVPGVVVTACQRLIPDLHLYPIDERGMLEWSATVRLPTEEGDVFELGPIIGRIPCNVVRRASARDSQLTHEALSLYASGVTPEAIAVKLGMARGAAWALVRSALADQGIPDGSLSRLRSAPVRELRMLFGLVALKRAGSMVAEYVSDPTALAIYLESGGIVPEGADPAWAAGTIALYNGELSLRASWASRDLVGQLAVDTVVAQGGSCTVGVLLERIGPLEMSVGPALARVLGRYQRYHPAVLRAENSVGAGPGKPMNRDETVRLVECPHCGMGLTKVLRITEAPRHLVCWHCRRTPTANYKFPDGYFETATDQFAPDVLGVEPGRRETGRAPKDSTRTWRLLGESEIKTILAEYEDHSITLGGKTGVLARHGITSGHLYSILRQSSVAPRRPYRKRQFEKSERLDSNATNLS